MIDEKKIETAIRMLLEGIGEDVERPGLMETPKRIANTVSYTHLTLPTKRIV